MFHAASRASREDSNNIETVALVLKGFLDLAVIEDLISGLGLINEDNNHNPGKAGDDEQSRATPTKIALLTLDALFRRWFNTMIHSYEETLKQTCKRKTVASIGSISALRATLKTHQTFALN